MPQLQLVQVIIFQPAVPGYFSGHQQTYFTIEESKLKNIGFRGVEEGGEKPFQESSFSSFLKIFFGTQFRILFYFEIIGRVYADVIDIAIDPFPAEVWRCQPFVYQRLIPGGMIAVVDPRYFFKSRIPKANQLTAQEIPAPE